MPALGAVEEQRVGGCDLENVGLGLHLTCQITNAKPGGLRPAF